MLNQLKEQKLYSTLERFYTNELRNNVFFDKPITREVKLSKHEKLLTELIKGKSATRLLGMYKASQKDSLSRVLRKLQIIIHCMQNCIENLLKGKVLDFTGFF